MKSLMEWSLKILAVLRIHVVQRPVQAAKVSNQQTAAAMKHRQVLAVLRIPAVPMAKKWGAAPATHATRQYQPCLLIIIQMKSKPDLGLVPFQTPLQQILAARTSQQKPAAAALTTHATII